MQSDRLVSIGVAVLAIIQGLFGILRGFYYMHLGEELVRQGPIGRPLMGAVAYGRGVMIVLVVLLSFIFAAGVLLRKSSVWWCGFGAAVLNILLVLGILIDGERIAESLLWLVIPVLVIWFLFSRFGWQPGYGANEIESKQ